MESTKSESVGNAAARPRLLDQVRATIRRKYYSRSTHVLNKGGRGVKSPLDSGAGQPPVAGDSTASYVATAGGG